MGTDTELLEAMVAVVIACAIAVALGLGGVL
jgi:hypothetical protein